MLSLLSRVPVGTSHRFLDVRPFWYTDHWAYAPLLGDMKWTMAVSRAAAPAATNLSEDNTSAALALVGQPHGFDGANQAHGVAVIKPEKVNVPDDRCNL